MPNQPIGILKSSYDSCLITCSSHVSQILNLRIDEIFFCFLRCIMAICVAKFPKKEDTKLVDRFCYCCQLSFSSKIDKSKLGSARAGKLQLELITTITHLSGLYGSKVLHSCLYSRCGRVMADNIAYAKFRKSLLI